MKKVLTLVFFVMLVATINAQTFEFKPSPDSPTEVQTKYVYCELVEYRKVFTTQVTIEVDFGQRTKLLEDNRLKDEQTGKVKTFNSMVDALNYMGEDGWEFVQAYERKYNETIMYHWVLKKKVEAEPLIKLDVLESVQP